MVRQDISKSWQTAVVILLIFIRLYRKNIQAYIEAGTTSSVQNILVILVESGFLYCFIWVCKFYASLFPTECLIRRG